MYVLEQLLPKRYVTAAIDQDVAKLEPMHTIDENPKWHKHFTENRKEVLKKNK